MTQTPILTCENLGKKYANNGFKLSPIDIALNANEITGLVGENGNGKTTLLSMLAGELHPSEGSIQFHFSESQKWEDVKPKIGLITQDLKQWAGTVYNNLHFSASINGIKGEENEKYVDKLIKDLGLWDYRLLDWSALSGGYKMRFELAKVLASKPRLLILDEPLANLDIKAQTNFLNDLKDFQHSVNYDLSIIVSSQHLYKIEEVSDQIIFLKQGECVYKGRVDEMHEGQDTLVYEVVVLENQQNLIDAISIDLVKKYNQSGNTFLIYCNKALSPKAFLSHLLNADIEIYAYRNISNSTRKFFE